MSTRFIPFVPIPRWKRTGNFVGSMDPWRSVEKCLVTALCQVPCQVKNTHLSKNEKEMEEELCCFQREGRRAIVTTTSNPNSIPASPGHNNHDSIYTESNQPPLPTHDPDDEYHHGRGIMICASLTEKRVLIAHRDQLAIFDFSCPSLSSSCGYGHDSDWSPPLEALLLWTHKMRVMIHHISLSGDGCAIALVLRREGVGVPYPYGVRTFVRDRDDGSSAGGSGWTSTPFATDSSSNRKTAKTSSDGIGIESSGD